MLDTTTKKRIDDCRDILVGKLPDPKAQIEQITIALIYKFMDDMDKEAIELGGKAKFFSNYEIPDPDDHTKKKIVPFEKYSWDNLFDTKVTATEMLRLYSEAIEGMELNPNIPQLFRDIFRNAYLPYRDPETLKLFLKTIDGFQYTHSEKLGDAFEYLLSVMGSQGDAGQFRTPRHIIDFLVAIVDPGKNDTILDPACGTAGFLISAFKHIMNNRRDAMHGVSTTITPDEQKKIIQNFAGYDISPDMVRLSLVNLYLHGFSDPHIHEYDTLSSEERWNETYDVILANPPFMSPKGGIRPHKKFTISSNRSEVLFVDYIAEHLNPKGRAGVIVPEGVIFQSGTAYKDLRKMLVENYLYAVVSLPAGVFNPYSGVKTSILLMDKEVAKQKNEILFVKIDNDGFNLGAQRTAIKGSQLEEAIEVIHDFANRGRDAMHRVSTMSDVSSTLAHAVPKTEIAKNGDYNLSGERYRVISHNFRNQWDVVPFDQICVLQRGYDLPKQKWINGEFPIVGSNGIIGFHSEFKEKGPGVVTGRSGTIGKVHYIEYDYYWPHNTSLFVKDFKGNEPKYIKLLLEYLDLKNLGQNTAAVPSLDRKNVHRLLVPKLPLEIQQQLVAEIEGYQKIIDGARQVVENYQPKIDIDPEWEMVELGEVCEIKRGRFSHRPRNAPQFYGGKYPFIQTGDVVKSKGGKVPYTQTLNELGLSVSKLFKPTIVLIAIAANIGDTGILDYEACFTDSVVGLIPNERINPYYLELIMRTQKQRLNDIAPQAAQKNINVAILKEVVIPIAPLEIQNQIVSQIEKEQELVNANKQLIEIFEQKIKDRIAKVWGEEKSDEDSFSVAAEPEVEYKKS